MTVVKKKPMKDTFAVARLKQNFSQPSLENRIHKILLSDLIWNVLSLNMEEIELRLQTRIDELQA